MNATELSEYSSGWNDAVARCSERMEALAARIDEAGNKAIAGSLRRLVDEIRGADGKAHARGRRQVTAG